MYKVFFQTDEFNSIEFSRHVSLEDAVALALYLHRSSNVKHSITVFETEPLKNCITFERGENV